jgi:hypothetical protein
LREPGEWQSHDWLEMPGLKLAARARIKPHHGDEEEN